MQPKQWISLFIGTTILCLVSCGCSKSLSIQAQADQGIRNQYIRVDIVGLNTFEKDIWMNPETTLEDYWIDQSGRRKQAIDQGILVTQEFNPSRLDVEMTLTKKHPVWKKWRKNSASHFIVLMDRCQDKNTWRLCLPLRKKCWKGSFKDQVKRGGKERIKDNCITVRITENGIIPVTTPIPGCE